MFCKTSKSNQKSRLGFDACNTVAFFVLSAAACLGIFESPLQAAEVYQSEGWVVINAGNAPADIRVTKEGGGISVFERMNRNLETRIGAFDKDGVASILFIGSTGNDVFSNETSFYANAYGFGGNDIMTSEGEADFDGGAGNDVLIGGDEDDVLRGGEGNDQLMGQRGDDSLIGGTGSDWLHGGDGDDQLVASPAMEVDGDNRLYGGKGDDVLIGGLGDDLLDGGKGNDRLWGLDGDDVLFGSDGNDLLNGGDGDDILDGLDGDDFLDGGTGVDQLFGGDDDDTLYGGADAGDVDELQGDDGNDIFVDQHSLDSNGIALDGKFPTNDRFIDKVEEFASDDILDGVRNEYRN